MGTLFSMALKKMHPIHLKGVRPWRWILWTDCNECYKIYVGVTIIPVPFAACAWLIFRLRIVNL